MKNNLIVSSLLLIVFTFQSYGRGGGGGKGGGTASATQTSTSSNTPSTTPAATPATEAGFHYKFKSGTSLDYISWGTYQDKIKLLTAKIKEAQQMYDDFNKSNPSFISKNATRDGDISTALTKLKGINYGGIIADDLRSKTILPILSNLKSFSYQIINGSKTERVNFRKSGKSGKFESLKKWNNIQLNQIISDLKVLYYNIPDGMTFPETTETDDSKTKNTTKISSSIKLSGFTYSIKNDLPQPPLNVTNKEIDTILPKVLIHDFKFIGPWNNKLWYGNNLKGAITQLPSGQLQILLRRLPVGYQSTGTEVSPTDTIKDFYLFVDNNPTLNNPQWYVSIPYALTEYGVTTIPFKYNFGYGKQVPDNTTTNINIAMYFGRKLGCTRFFYDPTYTYNLVSFMFSGFVGPTMIAINKANSFDQVYFSGNNASATLNEIGVSGGGAVSLEFHNFNLSALLGTDIPFGAAGKQWYYAKHPWLGFGIGYNLGMFAKANNP